MKIYCAGPIRGDRTYSRFFGDIVLFVQKMDHVPLTEFAAQVGEGRDSTSHNQGIYQRDMEWLHQAQALIAEVSAPSLGVGYEISYALHLRKIPVLCLRHRSSEFLSAMLSGNTSELLTLKTYESTRELAEIIGRFISKYAPSA